MNPPSDPMPDPNADMPVDMPVDMHAIIAQWQAARERYDTLNHAINDLFARYGTSDKMTPEAIAEYRDLQQGRDDAYNVILGLEMQFFSSDDVL